MQDYGLLRHFIPRNNTAVRFRHYKALYRGLQGNSIYAWRESIYAATDFIPSFCAASSDLDTNSQLI